MNIKKTFSKDSNPLDAFLIGLLAVIIFYGLLWLLFTIGMQQPEHRIFILLGGSWPTGLIQAFTFLAFFWAMIMLGAKSRKQKWEASSLTLDLLPTKEHRVILPEHVNDLRLQISQLGERKESILAKVLERATTKFRANKSPHETMDIVKIQSEMELDLMESSYGIIRYLAWSIPSIGFIGTVLGISGALANADQAAAGDISAVTSMLGTAFDTTLVALLLSIILMFQLHLTQQKDESMIFQIQDYVFENFINRIYVPKEERG